MTVRWLALVALSASAAIFPAVAQVALAEDDVTASSEELISVGANVRGFVPKDTFDAPPRADFSGRAFSIEHRVSEQAEDTCLGTPVWQYDVAKQEMQLLQMAGIRLGFSLKDRDGGPTPFSGKSLLQTVLVKCVREAKGSYRASNAFGATRTIYRRLETSTEIAVRTPSGDAPTLLFSSTIPMSPEKARDIAPHLVVRISGRLENWDHGSAVVCGIDKSRPKMTSVYDTTTDTCIFRGTLDAVVFYDARTGQIIAEKSYD